MRSIKELLQLMLDNQKYFLSGLCIWIGLLYENDIISERELLFLKQYIKEHRPTKRTGTPFYWRQGNIKPRINWINKHIKLLS